MKSLRIIEDLALALGQWQHGAHYMQRKSESQLMRLPLLPPLAPDRPFDVIALGLNSLDIVAVIPHHPVAGGKTRIERLATLARRPERQRRRRLRAPGLEDAIHRHLRRRRCGADRDREPRARSASTRRWCGAFPAPPVIPRSCWSMRAAAIAPSSGIATRGWRCRPRTFRSPRSRARTRAARRRSRAARRDRRRARRA